jgi:hypothetical protein
MRLYTKSGLVCESQALSEPQLSDSIEIFVQSPCYARVVPLVYSLDWADDSSWDRGV